VETACINCGHRLPSKNYLCQSCLDEETFGVTMVGMTNKVNNLLNKQSCSEQKCTECSGSRQQASLFKEGIAIHVDGCSNIDCEVFADRCKQVIDIEDAHSAIESLRINFSNK